MIKVPETVDDWLVCMELPEYLAMIPLGHLMSIAGVETWVDGNGAGMCRDDFMAVHGVDPAIVWAAKKRYLAEKGPGVHREV